MKGCCPSLFQRQRRPQNPQPQQPQQPQLPQQPPQNLQPLQNPQPPQNQQIRQIRIGPQRTPRFDPPPLSLDTEPTRRYISYTDSEQRQEQLTLQLQTVVHNIPVLDAETLEMHRTLIQNDTEGDGIYFSSRVSRAPGIVYMPGSGITPTDSPIPPTNRSKSAGSTYFHSP